MKQLAKEILNMHGIENISRIMGKDIGESVLTILRELDEQNIDTSNFTQGFACACAIMVAHNGGITSTEIEDVYKCNFNDENGLRRHKVHENDIKALKPVIAEIKRKNKLQP